MKYDFFGDGSTVFWFENAGGFISLARKKTLVNYSIEYMKLRGRFWFIVSREIDKWLEKADPFRPVDTVYDHCKKVIEWINSFKKNNMILHMYWFIDDETKDFTGCKLWGQGKGFMHNMMSIQMYNENFEEMIDVEQCLFD